MGALAFDASQNGTPVGCHTYLVEEDHWSWSDGIYELHGYAPQAVPATTALMLQHKHPDDTTRAFGVLETAIRDGDPFSRHHRVIDANQQVRSVLSVGPRNGGRRRAGAAGHGVLRRPHRGPPPVLRRAGG
jgi:hypothetical protein